MQSMPLDVEIEITFLVWIKHFQWEKKEKKIDLNKGTREVKDSEC